MLRWVLRLCLQWALPKGWLHQDLHPELEARCRLRHRLYKLEPACRGVCGRVCERRRHRHLHLQRPSGSPGGQGEQRFHQAQTGDGDPQWSEASQSREDPAEQEDGSLLRTGAGRHNGGHQAGLRGCEEAVHTGWETGEMMLLLMFYSCGQTKMPGYCTEFCIVLYLGSVLLSINIWSWKS